MLSVERPEVVMKRISSLSFWLFIFFAIIVVQAYSTFGQKMEMKFSTFPSTERVMKVQNPIADCFTSFTQRSGGIYGMDKSTVFLSPLRPKWVAGNSCIDKNVSPLVP